MRGQQCLPTEEALLLSLYRGSDEAGDALESVGGVASAEGHPPGMGGRGSYDRLDDLVDGVQDG